MWHRHCQLLLAKHFGQPVLCVDTSSEFLAVLTSRAKQAKLEDLIVPLCTDMGALDPAVHRFDLLWSEGAAYNLTFAGALRAWRPLMADGGIAVVSELSWFGPERPREPAEFWGAAYPDMASEMSNQAAAEQLGYQVLFTERLPSRAWWANYYTPQSAQLDAHAGSSSKMLQSVIAETRQEMDLFRRFSDHYGYTFYVLQAV